MDVGEYRGRDFLRKFEVNVDYPAVKTGAFPVLMESEPAPDFCFDAFSSREPVSTSFENA
jgi:hypothetical protein